MFSKKRDYMNELMKLLDSNYELINIHIKEEFIVFNIKSTESTLKCPHCVNRSKHVHSTYQRKIQYLPIYRISK